MHVSHISRDPRTYFYVPLVRGRKLEEITKKSISHNMQRSRKCKRRVASRGVRPVALQQRRTRQKLNVALSRSSQISRVSAYLGDNKAGGDFPRAPLCLLHPFVPMQRCHVRLLTRTATSLANALSPLLVLFHRLLSRPSLVPVHPAPSRLQIGENILHP